MIPIKQRHIHDPKNGLYGDCHRAAIASILELDLDEVPHFADGWPTGEVFMNREREFLLSRGLIPIYTPYKVSTLEEIKEVTTVLHPNIYYLIGGTSRYGTAHTVVGLNGEIAHDPSLVNRHRWPTQRQRMYLAYFLRLQHHTQEGI